MEKSACNETSNGLFIFRGRTHPGKVAHWSKPLLTKQKKGPLTQYCFEVENQAVMKFTGFGPESHEANFPRFLSGCVRMRCQLWGAPLKPGIRNTRPPFSLLSFLDPSLWSEPPREQSSRFHGLGLVLPAVVLGTRLRLYHHRHHHYADSQFEMRVHTFGPLTGCEQRAYWNRAGAGGHPPSKEVTLGGWAAAFPLCSPAYISLPWCNVAAETRLHVGMLATHGTAGTRYSNHLITFVLCSPASNQTCHQ